MGVMRKVIVGFVSVGSVVAAGCSSDEIVTGNPGTTGPAEDAVSVTELLTERPTGEVHVRGSLLAVGYEYFGPDEAGWEYEIELCDELRVEEEGDDPSVECVGASVRVPEDLLGEELGWRYADFENEFTDEVVVVGELDGEALDVSEVRTDEGRVSTPVTTERPPETPVTTGTVYAEPLPIDELPGEDLRALRRLVRSEGDLLYLADEDFVSRVRQLRANCASEERLQEIVDRLSGRGPEVPQDFVDQHVHVCPQQVLALDLVDGVEVGG